MFLIRNDNSVSPCRGKKTFTIKDNDSFLNFKQNEQQQSPQKENSTILVKFQKQLKNKSDSNSLFALARLFSEIDNTNKRQVSESQFLKAIKNLQLNLTDNDIKCLYLFESFQKNGNFNIDRFIRNIVGNLSNYRDNLIEKVFQMLDIQKNNQVDIEYLIDILLLNKDQYEPSFQPDVSSGKKSAKHVLQEYLKQIDDFCQYRENNNSNSFSLKEFKEFYSIISFFIESDKTFEQIMMIGQKFQQKNKKYPTEEINQNNYDMDQNNLYNINNNYNREDRISHSRRLSRSDKLDNQKQNNENRNQIPPLPIPDGPNKNYKKSDIFNIDKNQPVFEQRLAKNFSKSPLRDRYNIINHDNNEQQDNQKSSRRVLSSPFSQKYNIISGQSNKDEVDNCQRKTEKAITRKNSYQNILSHEPIESNQAINSERKRIKSPFNKESGNILVPQQIEQVEKNTGRRAISPMIKNYNIISNQNNSENNQDVFESEKPLKRNIIQIKQQEKLQENSGFRAAGQAINQRDKYECEDDKLSSSRYEDMPLGSGRKGKRSVTPQKENNYNIISNQQTPTKYKQSSSNLSSACDTARSTVKQDKINKEDTHQTRAKDDRTLTKVKEERERENIKKQEQHNCINLFQQKVRERGPRGFLNLWNKLLNLSHQKGNSYCDYKEFESVMLMSRFEFNQIEMEYIFDNFTRQDKSQINTKDVISFLKGKGLNKNRLSIITKIYNTLKKSDSSQKLSYLTAIDSFKPKNNTDFRRGKQTSEQILIDFIENFENHHNLFNDSQEIEEIEEIEIEELISFYSLYSLQFDEDNQFESYMFQSFGI